MGAGDDPRAGQPSHAGFSCHSPELEAWEESWRMALDLNQTACLIVQIAGALRQQSFEKHKTAGYLSDGFMVQCLRSIVKSEL